MLVDYLETNEPHTFELTMEDDDKVVLGPVSGQFEVGRPAGMKAGQAQRFTLLRGPFPIPREGAYSWVLTLARSSQGPNSGLTGSSQLPGRRNPTRASPFAAP